MLYGNVKKNDMFIYDGKEVVILDITKTVKFSIDRDKSVEYKAKVLINNTGECFDVISETDWFEGFTPLIPKLPKTGLVVMESNIRDFPTIAMRTGKDSAYGFRVGRYESEGNIWSFETRPEYWRPATKADEKRWEELLEKEAVRLGFVAGAKTKKGICSGSFFQNNINELCAHEKGSAYIGFDIMDNGVWAEIIEDEKVKEETIEELLHKPIKDLTPFQIHKVWNALKPIEK